MQIAFDSLKFFDDLKAAEVPEKQARAQVEAMQSAIGAYDSSRMKDQATKGDILAARQEIQGVRNEVQEVRNEVQEIRNEFRFEIQEVRQEIQGVQKDLRLEIQDVRSEIKSFEARSLRWIIGTMIALNSLIIGAIAIAVAIIIRFV